MTKSEIVNAIELMEKENVRLFDKRKQLQKIEDVLRKTHRNNVESLHNGLMPYLYLQQSHYAEERSINSDTLAYLYQQKQNISVHNISQIWRERWAWVLISVQNLPGFWGKQR